MPTTVPVQRAPLDEALVAFAQGPVVSSGAVPTCCGGVDGNDTTDHCEHDTTAQWQDSASTIPLSPQTPH